MHSSVQTTNSGPPPRVGEDDTANTEIDDFIYLISHDVRASVRALLELPQWIAEDLEESGVKIDGSVAASIEMMNRHTGRLDRMLVDLLTHSRIGRMQEVRTVVVAEALSAVLAEAKVPQGFTLTHDIRHPHLEIGERDILTLLNGLIQNGHKHHDQRTGRIHLSVDADGDCCVLTVSDDGPGIPETHHDRVFGAMQTLRPRDEVEGSGMGLANAHKIATIYGGTVKVVRSVFGKGTGIEVRLKG